MKIALVIPIFSLLIGCTSQDKSNSSENSSNRQIVSFIRGRDTAGVVESSGKEFLDTGITLTVSYAAIECGCPQWFETKFTVVKFLEGVERFYLEPVNKDLVNANSLWDGEHLPLTLKVVGRFSKEKEMPSSYHTKGVPERARIFRYSGIAVVPSSLK